MASPPRIARLIMTASLVAFLGVLAPAQNVAAAPSEQQCSLVGLVCARASVSWSGGGSCHSGWDPITDVCKNAGYTGLVHQVTFTADGSAPGPLTVDLWGSYEHPDGTVQIVLVANQPGLLSRTLSFTQFVWTEDYSGTGCGVTFKTKAIVTFQTTSVSANADICDGFV